MAIDIIIQFEDEYLTIPINPEELTVSRSAENQEMDIIGLGKATRKGEPGLRTVSINSFFPGADTYFYTGVKPETCIDFIEKIWNTENTNNNVAKLVTDGLPKNLSMYFVIENFDYDHKAGEEDDVYYELSIKEYVPYGVTTVDVKTTGLATARANSKKKNKDTSKSKTKNNKKTSTKNQNKTYKVVKGDCLWNITKKYTNNGADWKALYNLNKEVIGSDPNKIKPRSNFNFTKWMVIK